MQTVILRRDADIDGRHRRLKPECVELIGGRIERAAIGEAQPNMIHLAKIAFDDINLDAVHFQKRGERPAHRRAHPSARPAVENAFAKLGRKFHKLFVGHLVILALSACAREPPPILPPQEPSLCGYYSSYRYSAAAAAVESTDALDKHNANERAFYDKCITNHPKLDPERQGGPR